MDESRPSQLGVGESSQYAAHLDRGWHLLEQGDAAGAKRSAQRAHGLVPEDPDACMLHAAASSSLLEFESAVEWYEQAIDVDPDYPEPYLSCAQLLLFEMELPKKAQSLLLQARELDELVPLESAEIVLLLAETAHQLEETAKVREILEQAPEIAMIAAQFEHPADTEESCFKMLAQVCEFSGVDPAEAEDIDELELEQMLRRVAMLYYRLARLHAELNDFERASTLLHMAVDHVPMVAELWHLLGDCEFRCGEISSAVDAALMVHKLDHSQDGDPAPELSEEEIRAKVSALYTQVTATAPLSALEQELALDMTLMSLPSPELLYEGLDPRSMFLILRPQIEGLKAPYPATLVVYKDNLLRWMDGEDGELGPDVERQLQDALMPQLDLATIRRAGA